MSDGKWTIDRRKTIFDGSRREQLRQARSMSVRERLEPLEQLTELSGRIHSARGSVSPFVIDSLVREARAGCDGGMLHQPNEEIDDV